MILLVIAAFLAIALIVAVALYAIAAGSMYGAGKESEPFKKEDKNHE